MKKLINTLLLCAIAFFGQAQRQIVATFDNLDLNQVDTFWNGSDGSGKFMASGYEFKNNYNKQWGSWTGWAYSNMTDSSTAGYGNQYSCYDISGVNATEGFAVNSGPAMVVLPQRMTITGAYVTNAAFAAQSMMHGDQFAKKFGGVDGTDKDWFLLTAYGYEAGLISDSSEIYLADFRSDLPTEDYILNKWTWFSLKEMGDVDSIRFVLSSSDVGQHGMNTPAAFCMDDFNGLSDERPMIESQFYEFKFDNDSFTNGSDLAGGFVSGSAFFPNSYNTKWKSWTGWAVSNITDTSDVTLSNQYSTFGEDPWLNRKHIVGFGSPVVRFGYGNSKQSTLPGATRWLFINNTVFGYNAIKHGTQFSKKFGGDSGDDPDFFILNLVGVGYDGLPIDTQQVVLADYRFEDNSRDFVLKDWRSVNLVPMFNDKSIVRVEFSFSSSDTGQFGINTPQYFAMGSFNLLYFGIDNLNTMDLEISPNPSSDFLELSNFEGNDVHVYNMKGQEVAVERNGNMMDIRSLNAGLYFLKGIDKNIAYIGKFIKQ
jgi:hypothetical protein